MGTEFHRDVDVVNRYITIDYWMSKSMCEAFREQYADRFREIDEMCETFTEHERLLGEFTCQGSVRVL